MSFFICLWMRQEKVESLFSISLIVNKIIRHQEIGWVLARAEIEYGIIPTRSFRPVSQISVLSKLSVPDIHMAERITNTIFIQENNFSVLV